MSGVCPWLFTRIEVRRNRPDTNRVAQVSAIFDGCTRYDQVRYPDMAPAQLKGVQRKLRRAYTLRKVAEMVFYDLVAELTQ